MGSHSAQLTQWPGFPPAIVDKIVQLEAELDATWPGWRTHARFDSLPYDQKARIKYCLKRHSLLTSGGPDGIRDWEVLVCRDGKSQTQCYAHPVMPANVLPDVYRGPAPKELDEVVHKVIDITLPAIAMNCGIPIERVEQIIGMRPESFVGTNEEWVQLFRRIFREKVDLKPVKRGRKAKSLVGVTP